MNHLLNQLALVSTLAAMSLMPVLLCTATPAVASEASQGPTAEYLNQKVVAIDVTGLKRVERDAVIAKLVTKLGQTVTRDTVRSDIQALFKMGFFENIDVQAESAPGGVKIIYGLRERAVISKIDFEGNERLSNSDLKDVVKIKEWSILDVNKVREDVALIQKHYEEKGFYLAKVTFDVRPIAGKTDEVELVYKIDDYDKVQIKKVTFLNNHRFTENQLKSVFQETREGNLLSFLNGAGNFKETAFKQDLQRLTLWYLDHGYVKFGYENPVVTVSDDKRWLYVTVYVNEGDAYSMGVEDFGGDLLFSKDELQANLGLVSGDTFNFTKRNADMQKLTEKYQDLGYAFTNVIPKMNVRDDTKTVDMEYDFEKGNLVYFNEINVIGNTKTHDKVIRRELKIHEGELFNGTRLRESRENVERLGYFAPGEVAFNTVSPKGKTDRLNVEITVKERSTGTITLGAGYGSVNGLFFTTQISEINLLGRGQTLSLAAQLAATEQDKSFNLGFTDPYAFDTKWSMGGDVFYTITQIPAKWNVRKLGFDIRLGHPLMEFTNAYITYKNEGVNIKDIVDPSIPAGEAAQDNGVLSSIVWSVVRDKRNNRYETTDGNYQSVSLETAGIWGDKHFVKWIANNRYYKRIVGDLVFRHSLEVGQINPLGNSPVPSTEKFYLGGPNNMKGFDPFTLGPKVHRVGTVAATGQTYPFDEPEGGSFEGYALFELEYPLIREAGLKFVTFFDAGNTVNQGMPYTIRTDAGVGFRWFSPIGPLRFEWGFPLKPQAGESTSVFNFFIGPPF